MNRNSLRAFSFGIIFATIIFTTIYYFLPQEKAGIHDTKNDVNEYLIKNDLKAIPTDEYEQLSLAKSKLAMLNKEKKNPSTTDNKTNKKETQNLSYTLTINNGMTSKTIATVLESAHIIDKAGSFEKFLIEHDLHRSVQIGVYHVNNQMSYQEIANVITKGK